MPDTPETWLEEFPVAAPKPLEILIYPTITQLADGSIVVCWTGSGAMAQILGPTGIPIGAPFAVGQYAPVDTGYQSTVIALADGGFIMAYLGAGEVGTTLWAEEFDAAGNPVSYQGVVVTEPGDSFTVRFTEVTGASSSATSVLLLFTEVTGATSTVQGRIYNPQTNSYGGIFTAVTGTGAADAAVTVLANGHYVVAAARYGADDAITYSILSPQGTVVRATTAVPQTGSNGVQDLAPSVAALADGGFVITWRQPDTIHFAVFGSDGNRVAAGTAGYSATGTYTHAVVAGLGDGSFVIVSDNAIGATLELSRHDADGGLLGTVLFGANGETPVVTDLADGRFAVSWIAGHGIGEVMMQIFDTRDLASDPVYGPAQWQIGTPGDDVIVAANATDIVDASGGNDTVNGGGGNDTLRGSDGSDSLNGGIGFDTIDGGAGKDVVQGMDGADSIAGAGGNDVLQGNAGTDLLSGDAGDDTLLGGNSGDTLWGGAGKDRLEGGDGADVLEDGDGYSVMYGNAGADVLTLGADGGMYGGNGSDRLIGGSGNGGDGADSLSGSEGGDGLNGGNGADRLAGLGGRDDLTGGAGADVFVFGAGDSTDVINDFRDDIDTLELDDALWGGTPRSVQQVLVNASLVEGGVMLAFGGGDTIYLWDVTDIQSLADDIAIV